MKASRLLVLASLSLCGCSYLAFLKPPSVPRERGDTETIRGATVAVAARRSAVDPSQDWATYNNTFEGTRFSPLAEIDQSNVGRLKALCAFPLGEEANLQSGIVEVGGVMFVTTAVNTYAIDAATCALVWKHSYEYKPKPPFDPNKVNRGIGYLDMPGGPRVFRGANDGRVYALDARNGEELWNVAAGDPERGETFPAAPIAWHGLVFIGNAGGDNFGVTGRMMAFDARDGGRVWSVDLAPENGEAATSWPPSTETVPKAGAASWTTYALDTVAGTVYVPTGNSAPDFLDEVRKGPNLYAYSVVAIDATRGVVKTWYQVLPGDYHDWDVAAAPALITTGAGKHLVSIAGKDGHLYGYERDSRARLYATEVTTVENATAPFTSSGTHFCPGIQGGVEWNGPSFSPKTNTLYVNSIDWCSTVKIAPASKLEGRRGLPWTGSSELTKPFGALDPTSKGWLTAVDADDGKVKWHYASPTPLVAAVTSTAGGLVFTGDLKGSVFAFNAESGAELWRHELGQPIGGGVVTYAVNGKQYVAVAVGMHSPKAWLVQGGQARIVVFGLR